MSMKNSSDTSWNRTSDLPIAQYVQHQYALSVSVSITHVCHKPVDLSVRKIISAEKEITDNVAERNSVIPEPIRRY